MEMKRTKISVIGAGFVGSTVAFALMSSNLASKIVIVDVNKDKAEGEAMDMSHGAAFVKPVDIISGGYEDTRDSDIIIITAGIGRKPGDTRLELINKNLNIFKSMIPEIVKFSPNAILLVVSNPVDVLSYVTYKLSGFPKERVIGTGTVLDTSRFKYLLSNHFGVDARNVHAYIMGEHGDSEIATWSLANIAGMTIDQFCGTGCATCNVDFKESVFEEVKSSGKKVIEKKGATFYAIGLGVRRIVEAILRDENSILTVSTFIEGQYGVEGIYMGVPTIVGKEGAKRILEVPLSEEEAGKLKYSAGVLKEYVTEINI